VVGDVVTTAWNTGVITSSTLTITGGSCGSAIVIFVNGEANEVGAFRRALEEADRRAWAESESRALAVARPVRRVRPPPAPPRRAPWPAVMRSFA
jgi:hypothetical protein